MGFIPGGPWARLRRAGWCSDLLSFFAEEGFGDMLTPQAEHQGFILGIWAVEAGKRERFFA